MGKVIAIANQKGGVAKTTTATALATGLKLNGLRTLLIDTDPQCNASDTYAAQIDGVATLYDLLLNDEPVINVIQATAIGEIIPSDPLLSQAESLLNKTGKEFRLKKAVSSIINKYDYIIVDTPPALGVLLVNALTLANTVIVPITADRYSLQGLSQLQDTISAAQEYTNQSLTVSGLLLSKYNSRTNLSKEIEQSMPSIAIRLNTIVFDTKIRESVAAKEAQALRKSLYTHAPSSTTARDYFEFIEEMMKKGI